MSDPSPNPSLRELLNGISTDARLLASQTLALARLEASTAASKLVWSGVGVLASVSVVVAGASVLVSALVLISDRHRPAGVGSIDTRRRRADRRGNAIRSLFRQRTSPDRAGPEGDSREPP